LFAFLAIVGLSRYDPFSFTFRFTDKIDFWGWWWRYKFLGLVSPIDLLLGVFVGTVGLAQLSRGRLVKKPFDPFMAALSLVALVAAVLGAVGHAEQDVWKDWLFQVRGLAFICGMYFVVSRLPWSERKVVLLLWYLVALALVVLALGFLEMMRTPPELRIIKYGKPLLKRDNADGIFSLFLTFLPIIVLLEGPRLRRLYKLALVVFFGYQLFNLSTSVFTTRTIIVFGTLVYLGWHYRLHRRREWMISGVAVLVLVLAVAFSQVLMGLASPKHWVARSPLRVIRADNLSVATRVMEMQNVFANLVNRLALLQGLGLGRKWYEFYPQPNDPGAWPPEEQGARWHLGVHVPILDMLLMFGLMGTTTVLGLLLRTVLFYRKILLEMTNWQIRVMGQIALLLGVITFIFDLNVPKVNIYTGVMWGILGAIAPLLTQRKG